MDDGMRQNAAQLEAAAAESMLKQAASLSEDVSLFRLDTGRRGVRAKSTATPRASTTIALHRK
jgi:hypothetical protein